MTTQFPIFDGHNDCLLKLRKSGQPPTAFLSERDEGHLDLPRAREGGFAGGMFAIFVPPPPEQSVPWDEMVKFTDEGYESGILPAIDLGYAQTETLGMMGDLFRLERASKGQIKVVRTVDEIKRCIEKDILAIALHFEGAEAIDPNLDALYAFYAAGLRSLGFVWSRPNAFGHGVPFAYPKLPDTGPGLTDAGKALVRTCNDLGILIDLSHLNEKGFWDVAALSNAPLVATHSCVHAISPITRNLTDKQIDTIGESGGVIGLNFLINMLREDGQVNTDTPLTQHVRHIDYIAERIGVEHVALGSDFDGADISDELGDARGLPKLIDALRVHGYDNDALRKITHENWLRVLDATWH